MRHLNAREAIEAYVKNPDKCPWCETSGMLEGDPVEIFGNGKYAQQEVSCPDCGGSLNTIFKISTANVVEFPTEVLLPGDMVRFLNASERKCTCDKDSDGDWIPRNESYSFTLIDTIIKRAGKRRYTIKSVTKPKDCSYPDKVKLTTREFDDCGLEPWMFKRIEVRKK